MDKAITTTMLIVASMIMVALLFNIAYPAIVEGGEAISRMANQADERMKSQVAIIHATGEKDSDGMFQDTNGTGRFEAFLWVKNIGSSRISAIERTDVFFGQEGNFIRVPHQSEAGGSYPFWTWEVENETEWIPTATLKITIHYLNTPTSGRYFAKVIVFSGASDEYFLGL